MVNDTHADIQRFAALPDKYFLVPKDDQALYWNALAAADFLDRRMPPSHSATKPAPHVMRRPVSPIFRGDTFYLREDMFCRPI